MKWLTSRFFPLSYLASFAVLIFTFLELRTLLCLCLSPRPGCSKLTMSLVNVSLKFQILISNICQYFFVEKICLERKLSVYLVVKTLNELTLTSSLS